MYKKSRPRPKRRKKPAPRRKLLQAGPGPAPRFTRPVGMGDLSKIGVHLNPDNALQFLMEANSGGVPLEGAVIAKAKELAMQLAGASIDSSNLSPTMKVGAKTALKVVTQKIEDGVKATAPAKLHQEDPGVITGQTLSVQSRRLNNAIVPDKSFHTRMRLGRMTSREQKFYTKWPLQECVIYQGKFPDRQTHTVSPGTKSFYGPFWTSAINGLAPVTTAVNTWRKGVEMSNPVTGNPSYSPSFLPANTNYGTVMGGQDFRDCMSLWGWSDIASCISAMTNPGGSPAQLPIIDANNAQSGNTLKFGIHSQTLEFHIENVNKFFPAEFTIQYWKQKAAPKGGPGWVNPVSLLMSTTTGVPDVQRAYNRLTTAAAIPNSGGATEDYTSEISFHLNAQTFGANKIFQSQFMNVGTRTVRLTAGGRLKVTLTVERPPFDFMEYANRSGAQPTGTFNQMCPHEIFCTVLAKGTQEIQLDSYLNGVYEYKTVCASNPVYYQVSNIRKTAKLYCPSLKITTAGTPGFTQANQTYIDFASQLVAFGEQRTSQFAPLGEIFPITSVHDPSQPFPTTQAIVIPVMTNQTESAAGSR